MKKLIVATTVLVALLFAGSVQAAPIYAGAYITLTKGIGSTNGGEFIVNPDNGSSFDPFVTFCVQMTEHIFVGVTYWVESISNYATWEGTATGGNDLTGKDYLDPKTGWIYQHYLAGDTFGIANVLYRANAVQAAIWYLEGEDWAKSGVPLSEFQPILDLAGNMDGAVLNLKNVDSDFRPTTNAQDLLAPIPEPGSMLLFGSGLVSLAHLARRRRG